MKSRLSYFLISGIIILSVIVGIFIWKDQHLKEIPKFNSKSFTAPLSAKYVPTNADLVFHWKINPTKLPQYIESYQNHINKDITNKKTKLIRDSFFELISLDFTKDISNWAGENGSFAMLNSNDQPLNNWLMVLEINKDINIEEELELIKDQNIINENIKPNNTLNDSKSKLIAKRINNNTTIYFSNQKEYILISSDPEIIVSSINELKNDSLGIKEKYKNIQLKDNLNDGFLLLEMSTKKVLNLIGQEKDIIDINKADKLISTMNIKKNKLILEGIVSYNIKNKSQINDPKNELFNMEKNLDLFDNLILIDNPQQYFGKDSSHPYQKLIAKAIEKSTTTDYSNLLKIILENTNGNLILIKDKNWLAITKKANAGKEKISDILKKEKFSKSNLDFKNKNLEIWSKIITNNNEKYELKEDIEAIVEGDEDLYIWSQDLSSISNLDNKRSIEKNVDSEYIVNQNNDFDDVVKIHLGEKDTEAFLNNFYPYLLLKTMVGNKLNFPKNINISVSIPTINYPDFVKFKIKLKTS